jgi:hypothetical protein
MVRDLEEPVAVPGVSPGGERPEELGRAADLVLGNLHAPDESLDEASFRGLSAALAHLFENLGGMAIKDLALAVGAGRERGDER